jgi:hypothetical protein
MIAQLQADVVQGPIAHPELGRTVIVRPTLETARANRFPTQAVIVTSAARRLIELSKEGDKVETVLVEGEKDPTSHPEFHEISANLKELLKKWFPKAKLCLQSVSPELERPQARHAIGFYDTVLLRFEAGTQKTYAALTGERPQTFKAMVENLGRLDHGRMIVRADFVRGDVDNSRDAEVRAWIRHLTDIRPAGVRISTPAKARGKARPVPKTRMTQIAEMVTEKTGIPVEVLAS